MIKVEKIDVMNFENAIRGARNPLESYHKMDSVEVDGKFIVGDNDLQLMKKLCSAGADHRKFMRQVFVSMDITAPLYWWKEFDTYKVGTTANSTSTMHNIHKRDIDIYDFSTEHLNFNSMMVLGDIVEQLNIYRRDFIKNNDKECWWQIIQLLPSSYNQKRTCAMTYENLRNMYHSRKNHKLDEWREFCVEIEKLPHFKELVLDV